MMGDSFSTCFESDFIAVKLNYLQIVFLYRIHYAYGEYSMALTGIASLWVKIQSELVAFPLRIIFLGSLKTIH